MCLPGRFRQLIAIAVIFTSVCEGQINDAGKVYPRRNHWAVGHLMGKKSIDALLEHRQGARDTGTGQSAAASTAAAKDRELERTLGPSTTFWALIRTLVTPEQNVEHARRKQVQNILEDRRRSREGGEEGEQRRHLKGVADLLLQALVMRENSSRL